MSHGAATALPRHPASGGRPVIDDGGRPTARCRSDAAAFRVRGRGTDRLATSSRTEEVADAWIYAGFRYPSSTSIGREVGQQIGEYVVKTVVQPAQAAML